ncbi:RNA polymerase subunit sigma [Mycolicibacterium conceptionense]|uniref:sigma-70 family RNA polymerase sigma factor n=1 Tax=Mycolicibacterium conceptionense TaxID=451644 RepID=UPI0007ED6E88|nr:sigma-70 family RNA polymerase sigma factor [Mycolicibacterium conceptionense]OBJ96810.1 RNA polymerase subunit sigma [Mycolicibacterium conceptionense]OMB77887.1 RNA polymerase subunit sigma [Mycolicibacterium conceptionense]OMB78367.1 RNA polymerase subunit sigma [Mycolicibacterium conceptionense]
MARSPDVSTVLDAQLRRVARGDAEAFEALYDATSARVYGLILRILRDPGYSEETAQDVYAQVWRNASDYDPQQGSALAWLMTLAHRRAVDRVRSEVASTRREARYVAASAEPDTDVVADSAIRSDERRQVLGCLGSLTDLQRQVIELAYYDGLTYPQVSERLSTSLGTVKTRMRDGLRRLRDCLGVT